MAGGIVDANGVQPELGDIIVFNNDDEYDLGVVTEVLFNKIWRNWLSDGKVEYLGKPSFENGHATAAPRA